MSQYAIEVILTRELAGKLAVAVFLVDLEGNLLFYNEPAEEILGTRFDETGAMPATEWATRFDAADDRGDPLPPEGMPLVQVLASARPAHGEFWIRGMDGVERYIEVTAFPIVGLAGVPLAAAALFWEVARR